MPNKPSLVVNSSPLVALVAALGDCQSLGETAMLVVTGEVIAKLEAGAGRDETARVIRSASSCIIRPRFAGLPSALTSTQPAEGVFHDLIFMSIRKTCPMQAYKVLADGHQCPASGAWGR